MTLDYPEAAKQLVCGRCDHSLCGHVDTAGHFIEGCHFNWDDKHPENPGCQCKGFELQFEPVGYKTGPSKLQGGS